MTSLLTRSTRKVRTFFLLLIIGFEAFTSSALVLPDRFYASTSTFTFQLHARRQSDLHVAADIFGPDFDCDEEANGMYSRDETKRNDRSDDSKHTLTFQSSFQQQSKSPIQLAPDINLHEFFLNTDHLLSAGKSVHSKLVPQTTELFEEWKVACNRVGACPPSYDKGVITSVRTAGISIPGLSVEWSAIIGTNLVHRSHYHQHPELEFVLIKDETKASGSKPILWIYNKLTRNGEINERSSRMTTKLFSRLGFYKEESTSAVAQSSSQGIDNRKNDSFLLRCDGTMEMKFRIPSVLGKLVFSSSNSDKQKGKAERNVSNLITRQIEKDAKQNVLRWEENIKAWAQEQGTSKFVTRR